MLVGWLYDNTTFDPYTLTIACVAMAAGIFFALGFPGVTMWRLPIRQRLGYLVSLVTGLGLFYLAITR